MTLIKGNRRDYRVLLSGVKDSDNRDFILDKWRICRCRKYKRTRVGNVNRSFLGNKDIFVLL